MSARRKRRPFARSRGGYVLVLFGLLLFGLFALAALLIDLGFARVAQSQMEAAADFAALEGLRGRDTQTEAERRAQASLGAAYLFDDDLDPGSGDPRQFGAGPVLAFSGGVSLSPDFSASQTMQIPAAFSYKPNLQANLGDDPSGDLVAGDYDDDPTLPHQEANDYQRDDFTPSPNGNAFLARLRRTNEALAPGVGETGGALPALFARGSLAPLDFKGRGIPVRSSAIAQARRARSVGRSLPTAAPPLVGAAAIAVQRQAWETQFPVGTQQTVTVVGAGQLSVSGAPVGVATDASGASNSLCLGELPNAGAVDPVAYVAGLLGTVPASGEAFVAIVADDNHAVIPGRIIGFGRVQIADETPGDDQFQLTRLPEAIAAENASASLIRRLPPELVGSGAAIVALEAEHRSFATPLLAPALAR